MNRLLQIAVVCMVAWLAAAPVLAQVAPAPVAESEEATAAAGNSATGLSVIGKSLGAAVVILGAAYGISKIGSTSVESMARQPEVAGNIQTAMLISAALIEGATFFALIVCMMAE